MTNIAAFQTALTIVWLEQGMRGGLNSHESKMRKGKLWAKWPVQIYNLNFAFSSSADQKGFLIIKEFISLLLWWFSSHSKSNIGEGFLRIEERYEGKGEGMVYVYHHRHGQGVLIKDLTFCSHLFYRTTGEISIWVELLRLNLPY